MKQALHVQGVRGEPDAEALEPAHEGQDDESGRDRRERNGARAEASGKDDEDQKVADDEGAWGGTKGDTVLRRDPFCRLGRRQLVTLHSGV
jgi:hypothetical protein